MPAIRINSRNINIKETDQTSIRNILERSLDRFAKRIRAVKVTLQDLNGPKGGDDKQCFVQLKLSPSGEVIVKSRSSTFLESANIVCDKIHQSLVKQLEKRRDISRKARFCKVQNDEEN